MKTHRNLLLIIISMMTAVAAFGMDTFEKTPRWVSDKGWWVIESNIHQPKQCTVYFYNRDGVQVYKEKLEGVKLDVRKSKTKMHLKRVLEAAVVAWEQQHTNRENESLVMNRLRRK